MEKEYIERGALLKEIQEEIDFKSAMYTEEQNKWFAIGLKCAYRDVKSQPIADVVSRAEARFKNAEITLLEDEIKRLGVENKQLKAEVERGVVEYIEKHLRYKRKMVDIPFTSRDMRNYQCGAIDVIEYFEELVNELKEKYAKGGEQK